MRAVKGDALLDVIIDFSVRHQGRAFGFKQRLIAGFEIDDRQAALHHGEAAGRKATAPVGATVNQRRFQGIQHGRGRCRAVIAHETGDAAHQAAAFSKNSRYRRTTISSVKPAL